MKTFEDFLKEQHAEEYMGTDDDMPEAFENWMANLDVQEVIEYAEAWGGEFQKMVIGDLERIGKALKGLAN